MSREATLESPLQIVDVGRIFFLLKVGSCLCIKSLPTQRNRWRKWIKYSIVLKFWSRKPTEKKKIICMWFVRGEFSYLFSQSSPVEMLHTKLKHQTVRCIKCLSKGNITWNLNWIRFPFFYLRKSALEQNGFLPF